MAAVISSWTPTAVADTTSMTDLGHQTIQGGTTTQRGEVREVYLGGQAGSSAPMAMVFGRTSTIGVTLTAKTMAALDPHATTTTPPTSYQTSTTKPGRHATLGMLLNLSFNGFGGIVRWYAGPDETISYYGTAASLGELSLNAVSGVGTMGLLGSNIVLEVV
jgi:hypothetical protein